MTTPELLSRVMKQWQPPAYYVLTEVRNTTGFNRREGYADVLAMSIWPSRGLELIGGELKVSRSDWMHEYKDPEKAEKFVRHCHRWYLITGPDVAREEEIPAAWGWMVAGEKGLRTVKAAPELKPELPDWGFIASLFRNIGAKSQGMVAQSEVDKLALARANAMRESDKEGLNSIKRRFDMTCQELRTLQDAVTAFNMASGIQINAWRPDAAEWKAKAELFKAFMDKGHVTVASGFQNIISQLENHSAYLRRAVDDYQRTRDSFAKV